MRSYFDQQLATAIVAALAFGSILLSSAVASAKSDQLAALSTPSAISPSRNFDFEALQKKIRNTKAMGFFEKLSLKNNIDDLVKQIGSAHQGSNQYDLQDLRTRFEILLQTTVVSIENKDFSLAQEIRASRQPLWNILSSAKRFALAFGQPSLFDRSE